MTAFFHSFSSHPFDTDDTFLRPARLSFTHFLLDQFFSISTTATVNVSQERGAVSLQMLETKIRDLQLFYYIRVVAKLPIETFQRLPKCIIQCSKVVPMPMPPKVVPPSMICACLEEK